ELALRHSHDLVEVQSDPVNEISVSENIARGSSTRAASASTDTSPAPLTSNDRLYHLWLQCRSRRQLHADAPQQDMAMRSADRLLRSGAVNGRRAGLRVSRARHVHRGGRPPRTSTTSARSSSSVV